MISKYIYTSHYAEKLHELVTHIVLDVWYNAKGKRFYLNRIKEGKYFRSKVSKTPAYLKKPIILIYRICSKFNQKQLDSIKEAFLSNNKIEMLCNNTIMPVFYTDLEKQTSTNFVKEVKKFFNNLYSKIFNQEPFNLNNHYTEFFKKNINICPSCGIRPLEKTSENHRDDYDHYLPKSEYLFTSVNLRNLIPMCTNCNQYRKKTKNPIRRYGRKRKAFFYYSKDLSDILIKIKILDFNLCNITISFSSKTMQSNVDTWNYLFNLSNQYKEFLCHEHFGLGWHRRLYQTSKRYANPELYIEDEINNALWYAKENPLDDYIFLKAPFFQACKKAGVL